jgi:ArsR family transcriptional regulator
MPTYPHVASLDVRPATRMFRALGDETRLRIVALLTHGELCVCHIEVALGLSQPNASRQMGILRAAGVVDPRREGNWVYYRLAPQTDGDCRRVLATLVKSFGAQDTLRKDICKLVKVKGPRQCR